MRRFGGTPESLGRGVGVLFICFFLSGATGLIYQVVWLRVLAVLIGHTVYAITAVLAAFMAGLALGSVLFARRAGRMQDPIRAYGWLELGIGVYCALTPALFQLVSSLYLALHRTFGLSYDAFSLVQFGLVFLLLLVPTTLMGGTLPILSQALVKQKADLARTVGVLYTVNTFGAVAGVVLAGYVLIPAFGNRVTIAIAAIANGVVGAFVIAYRRSQRGLDRQALPPPASQSRPRAAAAATSPEADGVAAWLTVAALAVSGAVAMVYEVAWTRALALVIGSSTYAFTSMLVGFLVGIAGGTALYSWLWGVRRASPTVFAWIQCSLGVAVTLTMLVFERMPELFLIALRWSDSPTVVQITQLVVSAGLLLPMTLLLGATFPCAVAVAAREPARVGQDVGQVYALNTLGAIAGTVLVGLVLIPVVGVQTSIKIGIGVNLILAAVLFVTPPRPGGTWWWSGLGVTLAAAAGIVFMPPWDQRVMASGPAIYGQVYLREAGWADLSGVLRKQQLLFYRDGLSGTVSVNREGGHVFLRINGKVDASTGGEDMPTQLLGGHLPLLVHPAPKVVAVLGLGSGITAGAVARHPIERLDIVEIEPAVVEASHFFARIHEDVLRNPKVRMVMADGRNFLLTTSAQYDVIISEPSNPWIGGMASLFSVEFFELARQRLRPGGIMLQWLQGYSLFPDDLQMVVKTFRAAFPATSIWNTNRSGDFLLLGRTAPTPLNLNRIKATYEANAGIRDDLSRIGIRGWPGVLGYFVLDERATARLSDGGSLNTDDRLPLEFRAPRALYANTANRNWQLVRSFQVAELPEVTPDSQGALNQAEARYWVGQGHVNRALWEDALVHFRRALELDPGHTPTLLKASEVYLRLDRPSDALALARKVLAREPLNAHAVYLAGVALSVLNAHSEAVRLLERAVELQPQNIGFRRVLEWARLRASAPRSSARDLPSLQGERQ